MKLYNVKPKSFIKIDDITLYFVNVDGMYSLCYDEDNNPVHVAAWAEVEPVDALTPEMQEIAERFMRENEGLMDDLAKIEAEDK